MDRQTATTPGKPPAVPKGFLVELQPWSTGSLLCMPTKHDATWALRGSHGILHRMLLSGNNLSPLGLAGGRHRQTGEQENARRLAWLALGSGDPPPPSRLRRDKSQVRARSAAAREPSVDGRLCSPAHLFACSPALCGEAALPRVQGRGRAACGTGSTENAF